MRPLFLDILHDVKFFFDMILSFFHHDIEVLDPTAQCTPASAPSEIIERPPVQAKLFECDKIRAVFA